MLFILPSRNVEIASHFVDFKGAMNSTSIIRFVLVSTPARRKNRTINSSCTCWTKMDIHCSYWKRESRCDASRNLLIVTFMNVHLLNLFDVTYNCAIGVEICINRID